MTIFGIGIIAAPFLLIFLYRYKKRGFVEIALASIALHTVAALGLQAFRLFSYPLLFIIHGAVAVGALIVLVRRRHQIVLPSLRSFVAPGFVITVTLIALLTAHYNYTGDINVVIDRTYHRVENQSYPYPYFSDEWYAIAFIEDSIETRGLPLANPIHENRPSFPNISAATHSFVASLVVLMGADPLTSYVPIGIAINTLLVLLLYCVIAVITRGRQLFVAGVATTSILFAQPSGNLPLLWSLIPVNMGIIGLLGALFFIGRGDVKYALGALVVSSIFYPPLFVVGLIALGFRALWAPEVRQALYRYRLWLIGGALLGFAVFMLFAFGAFASWSRATSYLFAKIIFEPSSGLVPSFPIFLVSPWWVALISLIGILVLVQDRNTRWLGALYLLLLCWWAWYAISDVRVLVEYQRVVFLASVVGSVVVGVMAVRLSAWAFQQKHGRWIVAVSTWVLASGIVLSTFSYTDTTTWQSFAGRDRQTGAKFSPASPANLYLTDEDLRIFGAFSGATFLTNRWKGMTIGVATDNYPLVIKAGTLSRNDTLYIRFLQVSCEEKLTLAHQATYVYSEPLECPGFKEVDRSTEGFVLYKVE